MAPRWHRVYLYVAVWWLRIEARAAGRSRHWFQKAMRALHCTAQKGHSIVMQLDIFSHSAASSMPLPAYRRMDPPTSRLAAQQAVELQKEHHSVILGVLGRSGALGKDGIAARCGLSGHQTGKRMAELERMGLVRLTGETVASTSGRQEREWMVAR